ncbi:MAG: hypothetical protein FGM62_09030 [Methylobacterium sp.]|nr:hypothetical protein [Methylobacterium sp.]
MQIVIGEIKARFGAVVQTLSNIAVEAQFLLCALRAVTSKPSTSGYSAKAGEVWAEMSAGGCGLICSGKAWPRWVVVI